MKVGIITLFGYFNYGNRLQNYAMQEVLKSLGVEVDTLKFGPNKVKKSSKLMKARQRRFRSWSIKHIKEKYINYAKKESINNLYDYIVVGSDQIFTPKSRLIFKLDFLRFVPAKKKITYAASFGRATIPKRMVDIYRKGLLTFDNISVRENQGQSIVKLLTGKESIVNLDPTFLIDRNSWLNVAEIAIRKPKQNYLLTYFLGKPGKAVKDKIDKILLNNEALVKFSINSSIKSIFTINPGEFIDLINSSSIIFTDSYHGVIFSIIFKKPFIFVETRPGMHSRIITLFNTFNLNRQFENVKSNDLFNCDFSGVDEIIEKQKELSLNYLRKIL